MHRLTLIAPDSTIVPHANAVTIARTHGRIASETWLHPQSAYQLQLELSDEATLRQALTLASLSCDWVLCDETLVNPALLISDMDSTIIEQECIDELADCVGLKQHVAAITERAMNGELDFEAALKDRVALLKGLPVREIRRVLESRITLMPGARTLIATLRARGVECILVSGGFTVFTHAIAARAGFNADEANELITENDRLTGEVKLPILGKEAKRESLLRHASRLTLPLTRTIAIGDGANDLPMIHAAGLGIAYHAKPAVAAAAQHQIRNCDLAALLYVLGIPKSEWVTS
jgi:phosphoserine phosphatase